VKSLTPSSLSSENISHNENQRVKNISLQISLKKKVTKEKEKKTKEKNTQVKLMKSEQIRPRQ
jgi:hypothetical protein